MYKYLFLLSLLFTHSLSFANDEEVQECLSDQTCIETTTAGGNRSVFALIDIIDEAGEVIGSRLNKGSAITDIFYEGVEACYRGTIAHICNMGELMVANTNIYYTQGGHAKVENFKCYALNQVINFEYDVDSDYDEDLLASIATLKKCE